MRYRYRKRVALPLRRRSKRRRYLRPYISFVPCDNGYSRYDYGVCDGQSRAHVPCKAISRARPERLALALAFLFCHSRQRYPNDVLYTVIGSDSYNYINTWRSYELIFELSNIIVAKRPENIIRDDIGVKYDILEMNNDNSSTDIRKKIIDLILNG